ncbi:MAG TPA: hypothetical protein VJN18_14880, partial [Polyangiaceae bacterium]|nr:hypothetical protein [Polyangiaceae bacterium]
GQPCKNGKLACGSGPVCTATTNKGAGTGCGTDQVCNSVGTCLACVQDGPCTPTSNTCNAGQMDCATGPNCVNTGLAAPDGATCDGPGTYNFCVSGSCEACQNGNPCIPTNLCHKGTLNCGTAPPTCNDTLQNADDGVICGDNKSCISGSCVDNDRTLSITSATPGAVPIDAPFTTVSVKLVDKDNLPISGTPISVVPSAGAFAQASNTNASGVSQVSGRVGRAIGTHTFTISAPGAASVQFTVDSVAPTAKNIFTLVNVNHLSGIATPGPGTVSKLYYDVSAVAAATDGTLYFSAYCAVFKLSTEGVLTRIAGDASETCGDTGDSGLATGARVYYVTGLAIDEENEYLYLADSYNYRVRQIDLSTTRPSAGKIFAFAGGGANTGAPYGDGGPADAAYMYPSGVAVAPNGDVYISDNTSNRIRKVDFVTSEITTAIPNGTCDASNPVTLSDCGGPGDGCGMAWDKDGKLFISGYLCVHGIGSFKGIARVEANGSLVHLAGNTGTNVAEDGAAKSATFVYSPAIAFDKAGNLYVTSRDEDRVRRIDAATQHIDTVAGTGTAGFSGEYGLGTAAQVNFPSSIAFDGAGNLYIADSQNWAIRSLWAQGDTVAPTCKLAILQGAGQTVKVDAPFAALAVRLTDGANVAIQGVDVAWKRFDGETGSGLGSTGLTSTLNTTNAQGNSSMTGRVGLATGDYKFQASYSDLHGTPATDSPQTFTVAAEAPAAGIIFPVMNYVHQSGLGGVPGPATFARMQSYTLGVQAGSDGTIYAADGCAVYAITPSGEASVFAGTPGSCTFAGDSGPAAGAKLYYPYGMALDETAGYLYIADNGNQRIRMVSLTSGVIDTLAGGGSVTTDPFGDGGPAVDANIGGITSVSVDGDGNVYIPDPTHHRIRKVDALGNIDVWLDGTSPSGCTNGVVSLNYIDQYGSAVRFNADGSAYISGHICEGTSTSSTLGIILRSADGNTFTRIAGLSGGITTENADAIATAIPAMGDFVVEGNGNLVFSTYGNHMLRRISGGKVNTIGGIATNNGYGAVGDVSANAGNYVAASTVRFYNPLKLAVTPTGHLLVADEYNYTIRMIW